MKYSYPIIIRPGEDGWFVVEVPDLPGCITQGRSIEEAKEMAIDAITGWIEVAKKHGDPIPLPKEVREVVSVVT